MSAHIDCPHPATKAARAACRRKNVKTAPVVADLPQGTDTAGIKTQTVTRTTWRAYRYIDVEIHVTIWGAQPDTSYIGRIVAWGEKRLSYVSSTGARNTIDADRVKSVNALMTNV